MIDSSDSLVNGATTSATGGRRACSLAGLSALAYALACYLIFLATFLYAIGFVINRFVPKSIDTGPPKPFGQALGLNTMLLGIFGIQHSVMARPAFKRWWTHFVPQPIERSTYVLFSSLTLLLLFWLWHPMPDLIWNFENDLWVSAIWMLFVLGWIVVLISTCLIDHFDLFGLRQAWAYYRGKQYIPPPFRTPWLYQQVRHPIMVGFIIAFWSTPSMTVGHLLFSSVCTIYILAAIRFEEHDLGQAFGEDYRRYRQRVPAIVPRLRVRPEEFTQV